MYMGQAMKYKIQLFPEHTTERRLNLASLNN